MPGFRDTLRTRAVAALIAAATSAGASVYSSRKDPAKTEELPILRVSAGIERKTTQGVAIETPSFRAVASISVQALAASTDLDAAEATIETLIDEVQNALFTSSDFLAAPVLHVDAVEIEDPEYSSDNAEFIGMVRMRFDIAYLDEYEIAG